MKSESTRLCFQDTLCCLLQDWQNCPSAPKQTSIHHIMQLPNVIQQHLIERVVLQISPISTYCLYPIETHPKSTLDTKYSSKEKTQRAVQSSSASGFIKVLRLIQAIQENITLVQMQAEHSQRVVRIAAISDTHDRLQELELEDFPAADFFVHAGDITNWSKPQQFQTFREVLKKLPYKHKIVIGGNHDFGLMPSQQAYQECFNHFNLPEQWRVDPQEQRKKLQEVCVYLQHDFVQLQGIKFFGSPYIESPYIQGFYVLPKNGYQVWSNLPEKVDVMITHMPPYGILDVIAPKDVSVGSKRLRDAVKIMKPKIHIFGHIHESYGHRKIQNTTYYNVGMLDQAYEKRSKPTLIEFQV